MTIKFSDGIEIVIDDEKMMNWEQAAGNIVVLMSNGEQFVFSQKEKSFSILN